MTTPRTTNRTLVMGVLLAVACAAIVAVAVLFDAPTSTGLLMAIVFLGVGMAIYFGTRSSA